MAYGIINADTMVDSSGGIMSPISSVMRNRIINGSMTIDQRNAGASVTPASGAYTLDRYQAIASQASKFSVQQNAGSVTPPVGFSNYLGVTSLSAYTVGTAEVFNIVQKIEGFNTADLGWGTASAKTVTLSFQVYSSLTGTFGGSLQNSAQNRSYPFSYSVPVANTWTSISVTIAGDTTGTWIGATNGIGIQLNFGLGCGSTFSGTAGAWAGADYRSATGATSVVGTSGATFYITGCQLERGSSATGYEYRQYQQELALCQRYYEQNNVNINSCTMFNGRTVTANVYWAMGQFKVEKRTAPTMVLTNAAAAAFGTTTALEGSTVYGYRESRTATATADAGYYFTLWTASAEL